MVQRGWKWTEICIKASASIYDRPFLVVWIVHFDSIPFTLDLTNEFETLMPIPGIGFQHIILLSASYTCHQHHCSRDPSWKILKSHKTTSQHRAGGRRLPIPDFKKRYGSKRYRRPGKSPLSHFLKIQAGDKLHRSAIWISSQLLCIHIFSTL